MPQIRTSSARRQSIPQPRGPGRARESPATGVGSLVARGLDLLDRVLDDGEVVFLRDVSPDELGGDRDREVYNLAPYLLDRPAGLDLDLPFGAAQQGLRFRLGLLTQFLAKTVRRL